MSTSTADPVVPTRASPFRWITQLLDSSIGAKYLVALTGIGLTGFVIVHLLGNLQVFLGREAMNAYAQSLKNLGPLLWIARGSLLAIFVLHIVMALRLKKLNLDARPVDYKFQRLVRATWVSRHMVLTGLVILAFVCFHLAHFTFGLGPIARVQNPDTGGYTNYLELKDPQYRDPLDPKKTRHDVYAMFIDGFRSVPVVATYIVCMVFLGLHLLHGVRSIFQTLGLNHSKYNLLFEALGYAVTLAVVMGNVFMPLAVLFKLIGGDVP
ncbi:MAG: succinate dehydrogenase cytochrome b subunit [Gemmataceae bacterium]